jgi:hypothetical protein
MRINHEQEAKALELLKKLEASPAMQEIARQEAEKTLAARQQAAERLSAIEGQQAQELPKLRENFEVAEALAVKYWNLYKKASQEAGQAKLKLMQTGNALELQKNREADFLRKTASPEIDQAIEFFKEKERYLMQPERFSRQRVGGGPLNLVNLSQDFEVEDNGEAIRTALNYVRAAQKALGALKLEASFDPEKVEALKKAIPDHRERKPYNGTRQKRDEFPKIPIISDAQALLHQATRILRR